jgi:hypothetical protein
MDLAHQYQLEDKYPRYHVQEIKKNEKNAQKKAKKNIISETINNNIPQRIPI